MIKKSLIKKVAVLSMAVAMSLSMVACDKDNADKTEKEVTTEAQDTEAKTEEKTEERTETEDETTEAVATEAASTEAYVEDNGKLTVKHVTMDVPEGFEFYQNMSGTIAYRTKEADQSFAIYVEDTNSYTEAQVTDAYVAQVKNVYGSQVTSETKTYGGHEYTVMDIDAADGSYVGQAVILCEGTTIVYLEYVSTTGDESTFETIMNSITF